MIKFNKEELPFLKDFILDDNQIANLFYFDNLDAILPSDILPIVLLYALNNDPQNILNLMLTCKKFYVAISKLCETKEVIIYYEFGNPHLNYVDKNALVFKVMRDGRLHGVLNYWRNYFVYYFTFNLGCKNGLCVEEITKVAYYNKGEIESEHSRVKNDDNLIKVFKRYKNDILNILGKKKSAKSIDDFIREVYDDLFYYYEKSPIDDSHNLKESIFDKFLYSIKVQTIDNIKIQNGAIINPPYYMKIYKKLEELFRH